MAHVLLLRAPSDGKGDATGGAAGGRDKYETMLAPATSVPVYETVQTLDELQWILETGPAFHGYKGVIVTSQRSVDAWAAAARKLPPPADERGHWTDVPFYTVGQATAAAVQDLSRTLPNAPCFAPRRVFGGEETGRGEQLAHFILARLAAQREGSSIHSKSGAPSIPGSHSSTSLPLTGSISADDLSIFTKPEPQSATSPQFQVSLETDNAKKDGAGEGAGSVQGPGKRRVTRILRRPTKLLFLVGDKTRDALPSILGTDENIELDSVQVYATKPSPNFSTALRNAVWAQPKVKDWWIAIFAPSGADYAIPYLRDHFTLPSAFSSTTPSSSPTTISSQTSQSSSSALTASSTSKPSKREKFFKKDKNKNKDKGGAGAGASTSPGAGAGGGPLLAVRIAAIGPTTAAHLRDNCKLEVAAVAAKPNPEALAAAIKEASK